MSYLLFWAEINKVIILRFMWKCKGPRMDKIILKARKILGGLTLHNFNTFYKCTLVQLANSIKEDIQIL